MEKRKRFAAGRRMLCLALLLLAGILAAAAARAGTGGTCGEGMAWTLDDDGVLRITGDGFMTSHPWLDAGYYDESKTWHAYPIRKVEIGSGVKGICDDAFSGCSDITGVSLPDSLIRIGTSAFAYCSGLPEIRIPDSVISMGSHAFRECSRLTGVTLGGGLTVIEEAAFTRCGALTAIVIPEGVTGIEKSAFSYCAGLEKLTIPGSVKKIAGSAFRSCTKLTEVTVPCSVNGNAFINCASLARVTFLQGATSIGSGTFSGCPNMTSLTIPGGLTKIADDAFYNCWSLMLSSSEICIPAGNKTAIAWFTERGFEKALRIQKAAIGDCTIEPIPSAIYTGTAIEPAVTVLTADGQKLAQETDYTVAYANNTNAGTATVTVTGAGDFTGTIEAAFEITPADIEKTKLDGKIPDQTYAAAPLTPGFTLTFGGAALRQGEDYTPAYSGNVKPGTAKITVSGKGNFSGTKTLSFRITGGTARLQKSMLKPLKDYTYTGREIKAGVTVTDGGKTLQKGRDYRLSYENNREIGKATVTVTGIGDYIGTVKGSFTIRPKKITLSSLTASRKKLTVRWTKGTGIDGYEIEYCRRKDFRGAQRLAVNRARTGKTSIRGLTSGETWYVRIRCFKSSDGKKYYSEWSKTQSKKVR